MPECVPKAFRGQVDGLRYSVEVTVRLSNQWGRSRHSPKPTINKHDGSNSIVAATIIRSPTVVHLSSYPDKLPSRAQKGDMRATKGRPVERETQSVRCNALGCSPTSPLTAQHAPFRLNVLHPLPPLRFRCLPPPLRPFGHLQLPDVPSRLPAVHSPTHRLCNAKHTQAWEWWACRYGG